MTQKIDSSKAIVLEPGRRRRRCKQGKREKGIWESHRGDAALDAWGRAIRDMQKAGIRFQEE